MDEILKIFSCFYCFSLFLPPISLSFLSHFFFSLDLIYSLCAVLCCAFTSSSSSLFTHSFLISLLSYSLTLSYLACLLIEIVCIFLQYHPNLRLSSWCWIFFFSKIVAKIRVFKTIWFDWLVDHVNNMDWKIKIVQNSQKVEELFPYHENEPPTKARSVAVEQLNETNF